MRTICSALAAGIRLHLIGEFPGRHAVYCAAFNQPLPDPPDSAPDGIANDEGLRLIVVSDHPNLGDVMER